MTAKTVIETVSEIIECWDSVAEMADDLGVTHWTAQKWSQRGRIPKEWWGPVIDCMQRKGKKLSLEQLLAMHGSPLPTRTDATRAACR